MYFYSFRLDVDLNNPLVIAKRKKSYIYSCVFSWGLPLVAVGTCATLQLTNTGNVAYGEFLRTCSVTGSYVAPACQTIQFCAHTKTTTPRRRLACDCMHAYFLSNFPSSPHLCPTSSQSHLPFLRSRMTAILIAEIALRNDVTSFLPPKISENFWTS